MLKPLSSDRWNYSTAAHLLNRAGFGGPPADIQNLADLGPAKAVASLLDYEAISDPTLNPDWAKPNPEEVLKYRDAIKNGTPDELVDLLASMKPPSITVSRSRTVIVVLSVRLMVLGCCVLL